MANLSKGLTLISERLKRLRSTSSASRKGPSVTIDATDTANELCELCRSYDLEKCFYPLDDRDDKKFRRKWSTVSNNHETCSFCRFVMDSLALHDDFSKKNRKKLSTVDLIFLKTGSLDCHSSENEHAPCDGSDSSQIQRRNVRHLHIDAYGPNVQPLIDIRIYTMVDATLPLKERLLHFRGVSKAQADLSLAAQWLKRCDSKGQSKCRPSAWREMGNTGLRMIDVDDRCVVDIQSTVKYLALSYCWGAVTNCLKLIKANRQELMAKGSLSDQRSDLPQTIRDSILLTQKLKQKYLWVDALCICQDDGENKMAQILQMDKIYQHADVTIVAAGGDTSWSGLSRFRASAKTVQEVSCVIAGMKLKSTYPQQDVGNALAQSTWASRAWTFQEHLLSSRLLLFGQDEIFWECSCSRFAESLYLECDDPNITVSLRSTIDYSTKPTDSISPFQRYNFLVERITRRRLGFEDDRLNCMQGLLNVMMTDFPDGFLWGLPRAAFDSCLLFQVGPFDEAPIERNDTFPSWCWAGWIEETDTQITSAYDRYPKGAPRERLGFWFADHTRDPSWLRKEVAWFHVNNDKLDWSPVQSNSIKEDGSVFYQDSLARWKDTAPKQLLETTRQRFERAKVELSHAIAGWTQATYLRVDRVRAEIEDEEAVGMDHLNEGLGNGFAIRAQSDRIIGYISLTDEYRRSQPDQLYFILMSQHRRWEEYLGPLFDILHVEVVAGVTFRVQGVRDCTLDLQAWHSLDVSWHLVTMG